MRDPYDSLARVRAMAETPGERAEVGTALARYYARRGAPPATTHARLTTPAAALGAGAGAPATVGRPAGMTQA